VRRELGEGYELDDDPARIDIDAVHAYISGESYWGRGRARELVQRAVEGSTRVIGVYHHGAMVGFARGISDGAVMGYIADVYVLAAHRGRGLGLELVREMVEADGGEHARRVRWLLHTADAQGLYRKLGFTEERSTYPLMERPRHYDSRA